MLLTKLKTPAAALLVLGALSLAGEPLVPHAAAQPPGQAGKSPVALQHAANALVFSADGKLLTTAGQDHAIRLWDVATGKEIRRLEGHKAEVLSLAISPDAKTLASGSTDGDVRLWDLATGRESRRLHDHRSKVIGVSFSPDGKRLAAAGGGEGMNT